MNDDADSIQAATPGPGEVSRSSLPDWPRLMPSRLASAYLGIGSATLRSLDIRPCRFGRRVVWDRRDLDRFADRLSGQPLAQKDAKAEANEVERRFLKKQRQKLDAQRSAEVRQPGVR